MGKKKGKTLYLITHFLLCYVGLLTILSHIITHLRTSKHRRIAIFDLREGAAGPLLELYCGKEECGKDDAFDLGMARNASVFDAEQIFCRPCAVASGNFHRHDWIPFVDCHHPKLKCFNEKIVKVSYFRSTKLFSMI